MGIFIRRTLPFNTSADEEKFGFPTGLVIGCAEVAIAVVAVIAIIGVKKKKD